MFQKEVVDILQYISLPHPTAIPAVATLADMLNFFDSFCIVVIVHLWRASFLANKDTGNAKYRIYWDHPSDDMIALLLRVKFSNFPLV